MNFAILSPHRDDAAFSCGLFMLGALRANCAVTFINVMTISDYAPFLTEVPDQVALITATRRQEDEAFAERLAQLAESQAPTGSLRMESLDWPEAPLRLKIETERVLLSPLSESELAGQAAELAAALDLSGYDAVFAPLGLGNHVDHDVVRQAALVAVSPDRLALYEDLPYALNFSEEQRIEACAAILRTTGLTGVQAWDFYLRLGEKVRRTVAECYRSQISPALMDGMEHYTAQRSYSERIFCTASLAAAIDAQIGQHGRLVVNDSEKLRTNGPAWDECAASD